MSKKWKRACIQLPATVLSAALPGQGRAAPRQQDLAPVHHE